MRSRSLRASPGARSANPATLLACSIAALLMACKPTAGGGSPEASPSASTATKAATSAPAAASASGAPKAPASPPNTTRLDEGGPLKAIVDNVPFELPHGVAELTEAGLDVTLSSEPTACQKTPTGAVVSFTVPIGPNGAFPTGKPLGVGLELKSPGQSTADSFTIGGMAARVTVPAVTTTKGSRLRGTVVADAGTGRKMKRDASRTTARFAAAGTFDVPLCEPPTRPMRRHAPPPAPTGTVQGTVDGKPFKAESVLAFAFRDAGLGVDYVNAVAFYPKAGVTCATRTSVQGTWFEVRASGGSRTGGALLGSPQAGAPEVTTRTGTAVSSGSSSSQRAWITWERVGGGDDVAGTVVASTLVEGTEKPALLVGGRFKAPVCHLGEL